MLLLDTCIVIDYLRNKPDAVRFIDNAGKNHFYLSTAVTIELYKGVRNRTELRTLQKEIQRFKLLEIDQNISKIANKLAETYALSHKMGLADTLIAATALVYDLELRTYNLKDFSFIPGIKVSNDLD
jgi:predicted nucleic acid-binding protein